MGVPVILVFKKITPTFINTVVSAQDADAEASGEDVGFHQELKKRFIEGGPFFMGIVLLCLILGLAIAIERIIFLNLSTVSFTCSSGKTGVMMNTVS